MVMKVEVLSSSLNRFFKIQQDFWKGKAMFTLEKNASTQPYLFLQRKYTSTVFGSEIQFNTLS